MKRWLPSFLAFAFVGAMIYLANFGYAVEFFSAAQRSGADKLGHFALFGGLALVLNVSLACRAWRGWLIGSGVVALVATLEEWSHSWIPHRNFDLLDLAANYAGIGVGGLLARWFWARRPPAA